MWRTGAKSTHRTAIMSIFPLMIDETNAAIDGALEAGWNALIAGYYTGPVVLLSGDAAICEYAKFHFTQVETISVKEGIGKACISLAPKKTVPMIREGVRKAVKNRQKCQPFTVGDSYFVEIQYTKEEKANESQWYPGAKRVDNRTVGFRSDDFLECRRFFMFAH
ncbi:MAG: D-aminopeptidase [Candidatus Marinimicrobia bacterium]|nr:D-aminopeptidase [Candidatus Neomarinimicrobiota bacterium]